MKARITFFVTDLIEELTFNAVKKEAARRGYETCFSYDLSEQAQIGFYCCHVTMIDKVNAKFSVIMLHDIGQGQERWPNFWKFEPWKRFDLGFLPGPAWQTMYNHSASTSNFQGPLLGAYDVGWPKSDRIFYETDIFNKEVEQTRVELGLAEGKTILYAPSWENDGKQDDFVNSCLDLGCNLLIKQAPWPESHPDIIRNVDQMEAKYRGYHPRVCIMNKESDIMIALALSDILVTDESCVMFEALLFNIPSISVSDWLIPDRSPSRCACAPHDFVIQSSKKKLSEDVRLVLDQRKTLQINGKEIPYYRNKWFSHLGCSARACLDLIDQLYDSKPYKVALAHGMLLKRVSELEQKISETQIKLDNAIESLRLTNKTLSEYKTFFDCVNKSRLWRFTRPLHHLVENFKRYYKK